MFVFPKYPAKPLCFQALLPRLVSKSANIFYPLHVLVAKEKVAQSSYCADIVLYVTIATDWGIEYTFHCFLFFYCRFCSCRLPQSPGNKLLGVTTRVQPPTPYNMDEVRYGRMYNCCRFNLLILSGFCLRTTTTLRFFQCLVDILLRNTESVCKRVL